MNSAATSQVSETFLVLEDNVLLALDAAASVTAAGYDVVMTARGGEALAMMRTQALCGAILDFEVLDGNSLHVARRLMQDGVPFRVVSGDAVDTLSNAGIPRELIVSKPTDYNKVIRDITGRHAA